jgi:CBS domain-containing protein
MQVHEVMTCEVQCIRPDATLQDAAQQMKKLDVGSLPVCDNDRLAGIITDRDIAIRSVSEGHDPHADRAGDVMTREVFFCFEDQNVEEVAEQMREKQVRRLPVLNREKRLVGIVSLGDLAIETGDDQLVGHALEGISEPNPIL